MQRRDLPGPSLHKLIVACMGEWLPCQNRLWGRDVALCIPGIYNRIYEKSYMYVYVSRPIYMYTDSRQFLKTLLETRYMCVRYLNLTTDEGTFHDE